MAISSVGGGEPQVTPGTASPEGVQPGVTTEAAAEAAPGAPYAVINGVEYATAEDLTKAWDAGTVQQGASTEAGPDTAAGTETAKSGEDSLKGGQGDDAIPTDEEIRLNLAKAGGIFADPKYEPFALEFEKSGGKMLSDESLTKAAEAFGVPVDAVKHFIEGQIAQRQLQAASSSAPTAAQIQVAQSIVKVVPEEADYKALLEWGKEGLTAAERTAYDGALDRGDTATVEALLGSFQTKMNAAGAGKGPRDVTAEGAGDTSGGSPGGAKPYANSAQMQADMSKPEYQTDPAFREEVKARVAVSTFK